MEGVSGQILAKPTRLKPIVLSTDDTEPAGRFEAWRSRFASINDVEVPAEQRASFTARSEQWRLGQFLFGLNDTPARRLTRSRALYVRDDVDHWAIRVSHQSSGILHTRGRTAPFGPGSVSITSFADGYVEDRSAGDWACLIFARDAYPELTSRLEAMGSRPLPPSAGTGVLADYILSLSRRLRTATVDEEAALAETTHAILTGCLPVFDHATPVSERASDVVRRAEVERVIRRQIGSARLDVDRICALAGVSRSTLYRLFEHEGGVASYIRRYRLRLVSQDLQNPDLASEPIAALAERRGFHCAASFSRSFRDAFGRSPREAREAALSGAMPDPRGIAGRRRVSPAAARSSGMPSLFDILP